MIQSRDFPPVEVPIELDERSPSQTFLRHHERCPRAAYLYRLYRGGPGSHELHRGTLGHIAWAQAMNELIQQDERQMPPERGKDILLEVLSAHPELVTPSTERDSLRAMMQHWCDGTFIEPAEVLAIELPLTLEINGWTIRMQPDYAEQVDPWTIRIRDYKTTFPPNKAEFEKNELFQLQMYALGLRFGEAEGFPQPIGEGVTKFILEETYPRVMWDDGMARREIEIDEKQLLDFRFDVATQLDRLGGELETQKWEAVPGSHCSECPSAVECPIPAHLRPESQAAEMTLEDAEKLASWWDRQSAATRRVMARLKAWSKENDGQAIDYGRDVGLRWGTKSSETIVSKPELRVSIEGAVEYGHPLDWDKHFRTDRSSTFGKRRFDPSEKETDD